MHVDLAVGGNSDDRRQGLRRNAVRFGAVDDAVQPIQGTDGGQAGNPAFLGLKFEYGASATDVRHRFTFAPQYELPFGRGKQFLNHGGLVDGLAGGWKVAAIFQVQTGTPIALPTKGDVRLARGFTSMM